MADAPYLAASQPAPADALDLSVVIPTLNEEGNIGHVVQGCRRVCEELGLSHEILVVDGRSRDATAVRATEAGAQVIVHQPAHPDAQEVLGRFVDRATICIDRRFDPAEVRARIAMQALGAETTIVEAETASLARVGG